MSNKDTVKRINTAFSENKVEDFLALCTDDAVWTMEGEATNKGKASIREWMSGMGSSEPPAFTVDKMIAEDDSVICYGEMKMKGESGVDEAYSYCDAYAFTGDKVSELRSFVVKHKTAEDRTDAAGA